MSVGNDVNDTILNKIPAAKVDAMELDLSSKASVRKFESNFNAADLPLNILMYNGYFSYDQLKLANILHANHLSSILKEQGANVTINSVHPGIIANHYFSANDFQFPIIIHTTRFTVGSPQGYSYIS
ncbi:short-chain dehydrogenase TIC 32 A, chloroplastic-like [Dioscorea cayenensis subsp. rotundata]|uniref:Short-chain dehydrogenase TIC 32 A, chloroplastic-like n=1 Tax=Dioscorea cayennensis subsp. rotundata TaxID=55577 RepID=A0AB40CZS6_DIOCR|nr:short-chain dehydrogenase TIC 32 A, chloroplastic-like [Dioscorea cayenensis subsp. rotundata]